MVRSTPGALLLGALACAACASEVSKPETAQAEFEPTRLMAPLHVDTGSFRLRNPGSGTLEWSLLSPEPWLQLEPASGRLPAGQEVRIRFSADLVPLPVGNHAVWVPLASNAFPGGQGMELVLRVGDAPTVTILAADTVVEYPETSGSIRVRNTGKGDLFYAVHSSAAWLGAPGYEQLLFQGQEARIDYSVNRALTPRDTSATLTIISNDTTGARTVTVHVQGGAW